MQLALNGGYLMAFCVLVQLASGKTGYDYQSVRRWTTPNKLGYGLAECEKVSWYWIHFSCYQPFFICSFLTLDVTLTVRIWLQIFIPVHRDVHWCLAIIDMKEETFHYLDSLGGKDSAVLRILVDLTDVFEIKYYLLN